MKNLFIKFVVAFLAFSVGISVADLSRNYISFISSNNNESVLLNASSPATNPSAKVLSGKIEVRFVRFMQNGDQVEAEFELTNNTTETAYYYSYGKGIYPFLKLKRYGETVQDNRGRCGTGIGEHMLLSEETVFFRVPRYEVTYEPTKNSWRETDKPTQIGFPFVIGNERRKEILWSEEMKFPQ